MTVGLNVSTLPLLSAMLSTGVVPPKYTASLKLIVTGITAAALYEPAATVLVMLVTALVPHIGYDRAARIVSEIEGERV